MRPHHRLVSDGGMRVADLENGVAIMGRDILKSSSGYAGSNIHRSAHVEDAVKTFGWWKASGFGSQTARLYKTCSRVVVWSTKASTGLQSPRDGVGAMGRGSWTKCGELHSARVRAQTGGNLN